MAFSLALATAEGQINNSLQIQVEEDTSTQNVTNDLPSSAFGSISSMGRHYNFEESDIVPVHVLTAPGETLSGVRLSDELTISLTVRGEEYDDDFELVMGDPGQPVYPLRADYGGFAVFTMDFNGDGLQEIVFEHGRGRGTEVYERYLSIHAFEPGRGIYLLREIQLSGWNVDDDGLPVGWARMYAIKKAANGYLIKLLPVEHETRE
jgi:hypothetical protein